jgi:hypothetical protein
MGGGDRIPGGEWMLKILALCLNEETRANFLLTLARIAVRFAPPYNPKRR